MTLEQLRIFIAVAEREHVTRAAESLNLTQSAVSAAIATLEAGAKVRLFDRIGRGIALTAEGRQFLSEAKAVLARAHEAEEVLADLSALKRGHLRLMASQTILNYWLPKRLAAFRRSHPEITLTLSAGNTQTVSAAVLEGAADLGFIEGAIDDPQLERIDMDRDALVMLAGADHPLAGKRRISPQMLRQADWVLREPGSGTRSEFEAAMHAAGIAPGDLKIVLELPSNEAVRSAVEAELGISALSEHVAARTLRLGTVKRVPFALPERRFSAIRHRARYRSRAAEAFLDHARRKT